MTATPAEPRPRRAALDDLVDALRLAVTGRPRRGVLGFAPAAGRPMMLARWRAAARAAARVVRPPTPARPKAVAEWVLTREAGGWAVRPSGDEGPPAYFTTAVPSDDQNAAFDWAGDVTPDTTLRRISYTGPPPSPRSSSRT
ncbi:hypothetical protein AB0K40_03860 [Nonomuraea bangladeshensis]|uniref:Uncharacterized protein n=1 Tax=Nonomuraea bangladeshensis TaxID=404385 RepID=A0ABV3GWG8_9ACTN